MLLRQYLSISVIPHMTHIDVGIAHRLTTGCPIEA